MKSFDYNACIIGWNKIAEETVKLLLKQDIESIKIICGSRQMDNNEAQKIKQYEIEHRQGSGHKIDIVITNNVSDEILGMSQETYVGLSFDSPIIFKKEHIEHFKGRLINEHGAPLPDGRGGGGFSWRIMENDRKGAVLFHLVDEGIDSGKILYRRDFIFPENCRYPKDYEAYQFEQTKIDLPKVLNSLFLKRYWMEIRTKAQEQRPSLYFPRLYTPLNGWINREWQAEKIQSFILAFSYPYSGAKSVINGSDELVNILDSEVSDECGPHHPFKNGIIHYMDESDYWVCAGEKSVLVKRKHVISRRSLRVGDRLTSPLNKQERARSIRPKFDANGYVEQ